MDSEAPVGSLCLHKETRTALGCPSGVEIQLSIPTIRAFDARPRQQRRALKPSPTFKDQDLFAKYHIASSGSIHFSKHARHPRRFLWRVVQDRKALELRSADLSKSDRETKEAAFAVQICFSTQIKSGGVALVDMEDPNLLGVFVLTKGNELYTCNLPKDYFCYSPSSKESVAQPAMVAAVARPATFSVASPHCLVAGSALQLIISLSDGRLLQLTRRNDEDGSQWHESIYGDGTWGTSLRGLIRWQGSNTIRYDGITLEQTTPTTMAISPDSKHIFAVCLNHQLRIWNPENAASVYSKDLLWQDREPQEVSKVMLDPGNPNVLQLFKTEAAIDGDLYYAVTFSPHDLGQFKFWGIRAPDHGDLGIRDLFPDQSLTAPDPDPNLGSKAIWKVADFKIKSGENGRGVEMWILMRSNRSHKLYNLKSDFQDLTQRWRDQWTVAVLLSTNERPHPLVSDQDTEDVTEKWLDHIFCPGRYPEYILESALATYSAERGLSHQNAKLSIQERMCSAVASQVNLSANGHDFVLYRSANHQEWTILWQCIQDLDQSRWDVLSLAHDDNAGLPWIIFADGCSAIRTCSRLEIISQNKSAVLAKSMDLLEMPSVETEEGDEPKLPDELAVILEAASAFRQRFSHRVQQTCSQVLATELWLEPSFSIPIRMDAFYEQCNFANEIDGPQSDELDAALAKVGGVENFDTQLFYAILERFSHDMPKVSSDSLYTQLGFRVLIEGAREMINSRVQILSDLLLLMVVVEIETDREEKPMEDFDCPQIYKEMLELLKQHQIMQWLANNLRVERGRNQDKKFTILESVFALDLRPQSYKIQSQSEALTQNIQDLLKWVVGGSDPIPLNDVPVYIQCNLLAHKNIYLAADFLRYQPSTAWATYIKGRLCLLQGSHTEAALYFQKAAFKLCRPPPKPPLRLKTLTIATARPTKFNYHHASHSLLTPLEAMHLGHGLSTYYTHLTNLFPHTSTETAHFAHLALQLPENEDTPQLLKTLFTAALATTDVSTAFSALTRHPTPETLLEQFVTTLLSTPGGGGKLITLPFPPQLHEPINILLGQHKNPKILASWRLQHNDFRGAAAALLPLLRAAQARQEESHSSLRVRFGKDARHDEAVEESYLTIINLLACAGEEAGWVLSGGSGDGDEVMGGTEGARAGNGEKRRVVTLDDLRGGYQGWLDGKGGGEEVF